MSRKVEMTVAAHRLDERQFHTTGRGRMVAPSRKTEGVSAVMVLAITKQRGQRMALAVTIPA